MSEITVIGIGYRPLNRQTAEIIERSDIILASSRLFDVFRTYAEYERVAERVLVIDNVDSTIAFIRDNYRTRSIALLASGDPLFFGIGKRICEEFGRDSVSIIPDLSSVQMAFSRIKETWDDAFFMSLHGGPDPVRRRKLPYELEEIPGLLETWRKVAVLTDATKNPSAIAEILARPSHRECSTTSVLTVYVCEKLGCPDEKITRGRPEEIAGRFYSEPNVVIILKEV
ncbi:MAG TPA: precorrin-6y C5,15-methyltransferase (decarboxylating) subunit CbiE [Thermodesulfovibrionales bacterium]|nr:precorrin-6y C5,15-methyltransferase (decarboxylating) subunit CbiE [Thermodesulfovibrionales bacterium]